MTLLVISAGGIVRMTQSGMGCPDWPTCFGMIIPPTNADQLPADFEKYLEKQDIDHSFNVYHTWIEYINRLLGAVLGLLSLIFLVWTARKWMRHRRSNPSWNQALVLSIILVIMVGIVGLLGKIVVDQNLAVAMITIHMLGALVVAILPLAILYTLGGASIKTSSSIRWLAAISIPLLLVQVYLGTQVREDIDVISKALDYGQRELWIEQLGSIFTIHRSFSWSLLVVGVLIFYKSLNINRLNTISRNIILSMVGIVFLGIVMNYLDMPAIAQPLHLVVAAILFLQLAYLNFVVSWKKSSV